MNREILNGDFLLLSMDVEKLTASGWIINHSTGGGWWFENRETMERQFVPAWIQELIEQAEREGAAKALAQVRRAIEGKCSLAGRCVPYTPKPKQAAAGIAPPSQ